MVPSSSLVEEWKEPQLVVVDSVRYVATSCLWFSRNCSSVCPHTSVIDPLMKTKHCDEGSLNCESTFPKTCSVLKTSLWHTLKPDRDLFTQLPLDENGWLRRRSVSQVNLINNLNYTHYLRTHTHTHPPTVKCSPNCFTMHNMMWTLLAAGKILPTS